MKFRKNKKAALYFATCAAIAIAFALTSVFSAGLVVSSASTDTTFDNAELILVEGGTVASGTTAKDLSGTSRTGLIVGTKNFEAEISGVFDADNEKKETRIDYAFMGSGSLDGNWSSFKFKVADAQNPDRFFELNHHGSNWYRMTALKYGGETRSTAKFKPSDGAARPLYEIINYQAGDNGYGGFEGQVSLGSTWLDRFGGGPNCGGNDGKGYFIMRWAGNVLELWQNRGIAMEGSGAPNKMLEKLIARFDGTSEIKNQPAASTAYGEYGLPLMSFSGGYKISFSSNDFGICITAINGVSTVSKTTDNPVASVADMSISINGDAVQYQNMTRDSLAFADIDEGATASRVISIAPTETYSNLTIASIQTVYANNLDIDFTVPSAGPYIAQYSFLGLETSRQIHVVRGAPLLRFTTGSGDAVFVKGEDALTFSAADIEAVDLMDGVLDLTGEGDVAFGISLATSGIDGNYTAYNGTAFNPSALGLYYVKYSVSYTTPQGVRSSDIIRTILVVDGNVPIINYIIGGELSQANSSIPKIAQLNTQVTLPYALALKGNTEFPVQVNAYYGGDRLELANNVLVFDKAGTYTVVYFASDDAGNEEREVFSITVPESSASIGQEPDPTTPGSTGCGGKSAKSDSALVFLGIGIFLMARRHRA